MSGMGWVAAISLLMPAWCVAAAGTPLGVYPINEESLSQMQKRHPASSIAVDDPVYKRKQRYEGFWLRDLLKDLSYAGHPESDVYVRFRCKDGYAPIMPLSRALKGDGLIAVRDLGAPTGKNWESFSANGTTSTPAPGYLVWASPAGDIEEYPVALSNRCYRIDYFGRCFGRGGCRRFAEAGLRSFREALPEVPRR